MRGIKTIKLFYKQHDRGIAWSSLLVNQLNSELQTHKSQMLFKGLNGLVFGLNNILVLAVGVNFVLSDRISIGGLMAFIAYKTQFDSRVTALIDRYWDFRMLKVHCERLADIALTAPDEDSEEKLDELMRQPTLGIEVEKLRFRYSAQDPYILDGLDFKVAAGESVAIVGSSGCGKTTLMNVLLGVLTPYEGAISIGGINTEDLGRGALRRIIGTVLQDDVLFNGSLAENISFFDPEPDFERIRHCADLAAVSVEIDLMPMKYNTLVGDMGSILSGGQKQRVLLARALYKRPRILFLDEATSNLDVVKENEVNEAIRRLDITRVIIAHRPETIASADRVIYLNANTHDKYGSRLNGSLDIQPAVPVL